MKKFSKGFTIIELIVVIAIIAVLAGIVLVSVTQYINKSKDASAKADLDSLIKAGYVQYEANSNYNNFCNANPAATSINDSLSANGYHLICQCDAWGNGDCSRGNNQSFCASIKLKSGKYYCVDNFERGQKIEADVITCDVGGCSQVCGASCGD